MKKTTVVLLTILMLFTLFQGALRENVVKAIEESDKSKELSEMPESSATTYVPDDYSTIQATLNAANSGDITIAREGTYTENVDVNKDLTMQTSAKAAPEGEWSKLWNSSDIGSVNSIVVDDLDGDGTNEIIVGTCTDYESNTHYVWHGYIYIFNAIAHELEWKSEDIGSVDKIIIADLNGDGRKEIIAKVEREGYGYSYPHDRYGYIYVFDGVTHKQKWNSSNIGGRGGDLSIADLDGDGVKEIITGAAYYYSCTIHGHVYVFDGANFTQKWKSKDLNQPCRIVINDVDDDGVKEIIVGTEVTDCANSSSEGGFYYPGHIYIFNGIDFTQEWESDDIGGWASLIVNDIDDDGVKEIIAGSERSTDGNSDPDRGYIYVFDGKTHTQEWKSSNVNYPDVKVTDIDNDGTKEIITRTRTGHARLTGTYVGYIYVFDGKTHSQEWKSDNLGIATGLEVGDIDNDGIKEILTRVGNEPNNIYLCIFNGVTHGEEWQSEDIGTGTLAVANIDDDGWKEIIAGSSTEVTEVYQGQGYLYIFGIYKTRTHPSPPQNLKATFSNSSIILNWNASQPGTYPVAGYAIYKGTSSGGESSTPIATVNATTTTYTDNNVTTGTTYYYYVKAFDDQSPPNYSAPSNEESIFVNLPPRILLLTSPLKITRKEVTPSFYVSADGGCFSDIPTLPYLVGDTLSATFVLTNEGTLPIKLNKLTVGGRFNDGKLPNGNYPDFSYVGPITLAPGESYTYHETLQLTHSGNYHFFCAYQMTDGNWNTAIDLGEGLTDADRTKDIEVKYIASPYPSTEATLEVANLDDYEMQQIYSIIRQVFDIDTARAKLVGEQNGAALNDVNLLLDQLNYKKRTAELHDVVKENALSEGQELAISSIGGVGKAVLTTIGLYFPPFGWMYLVGEYFPFLTEGAKMLGLEVGEKLVLKDIGSAIVKDPGIGRMEVVWLRPPKDKVVVNIYLEKPAKKCSVIISAGEWENELKMKWGINAQSTIPVWNAFTNPYQNTLTDPESIINYVQIIRLHSLGKVRVYDSQGRVTGVINGQVKEEIPGSTYDSDANMAIIFYPSDSYHYEVVGTAGGSYGLEAVSVEGGKVSTFNANNVATSPKARHEYTINWKAPSQGEGNFIFKADNDGDGIFEKTVTTANEFKKTTNGTVEYKVAFTITSSAGPLGTISPSKGVTINSGSSQTFTITPNPGYHIKDVLVDGISVGAIPSYTFTNVTANHTIEATFEINTYTIKAYASIGGSITPSGAITVSYRDSKTFTITPDAGYHITDVLVDGLSIGAVSTYTFTNITANHIIEASFKKKITETVITLQPDNPIMTVNGISQEIDPGRGTKPAIIPKWSRTVVPIRAIVEALGGTISWNGTERKVTINLKDKVIELWIDNPKAKVNSETKWIDAKNHGVKPIIINSRTMLPLRFVAENLGCEVGWDPDTRTITITYGE